MKLFKCILTVEALLPHEVIAQTAGAPDDIKQTDSLVCLNGCFELRGEDW